MGTGNVSSRETVPRFAPMRLLDAAAWINSAIEGSPGEAGPGSRIANWA